MSGARYEIVAIGSSAGGFNALRTILAVLPADFPAAIVVVQHLDPRHESVMADLLGRRTSLTVEQASEGVSIAAGTVLIAPPDRHMLVDVTGAISLTKTELVHFVRPSVDLLFESVAGGFGAAAIGVILTGTGTDGAQGVVAVKMRGGTVFVQDDRTAEFSGMPTAAMRTGCADFVLPLEELGPAIVDLVAGNEGT